MSFSFSQRGSQRVRRALKALIRRGRMGEVASEINRNHAQVMRRRRIPRDTGRLEDSLTRPSSPDRRVTVSGETITIETLVPYAKYQRQRIRPLNRAEIKEIFTDPILESFLQSIREGR